MNSVSIAVVTQCISRHPQPTVVESALCCPFLEPLFSLRSQTACTQCTSSTLSGVVVLGTGFQPSNLRTGSDSLCRRKIAFAAHIQTVTKKSG